MTDDAKKLPPLYPAGMTYCRACDGYGKRNTIAGPSSMTCTPCQGKGFVPTKKD